LTKLRFTSQAVVTTVLIAGLLGLHRLEWPLLKSHGARLRLGQLISAIGDDQQSREEVDALVDGYYEQLRADDRVEGLPSDRGDIHFRNDFLRYELRPNIKRMYPAGMRFTNSMGMANPEYSYAKPPHTRRIALLGDSLSLGPYGQDFVALLENRLNQDCRTADIESYQVLNFSVYGYSIVQKMDVALDKAPQFHPDVYVVTLTSLELLESKGWGTHLGNLLIDGTDLKYDYLRRVVADAGLQSSKHLPAIRKGLKPYFVPVTRWALEQVRDHANAQGAQTMVFLIPAPIDPNFTSDDFSKFQEIAGPVGVPILDLRDTFRSVKLEDIWVAPRDIHPNVRGHALIADSLFNELQAQPDALLALAGHPCQVPLSSPAAEK